MIWISLLLTFIVGYSLLSAFASKITYLEKMGASFLLGMGIQTILMVLMDFVSIPLRLTSVYISSILVVALLLFSIIYQKKKLIATLFPYNPFEDKPWVKVNLPWLAIMSFVVYLVWALVVKCLFWPTFEFDAVSGYDLTAKVVAAEGSFRNSLFMSNGVAIPNLSLRAVYPPLVQSSFAYAYMSGMDYSKIMTSCFYCSFLVLMYGLLRHRLTHLGTAFGLLTLLLIPEMVAHAALSQTNLPQAVYTATGLYALYHWYCHPEKNKHYLLLSMFLLSANSIIRTENIVFGFLAGLLVLVYTIRNRSRKNLIQLIIYGATLLAPMILWMLFLKVFGLKPGEETSLVFDLSYNTDKFNDWWGLMWGYEKYEFGIVLNKSFYGLTGQLYFLMLLISSVLLVVYLRLRANILDKNRVAQLKKEHLTLIYISLFPFLLYSIFFYLIDYNWDTIDNVMKFSYKRGLFAVMSLFVVFSVSNELVRRGFERIDWFLYGRPSK